MANATDNRNYSGNGAFAQTPPKVYDHKVGAAVEIFAGTFVGVLLGDADLPIVPLTLDGTTEFRGICTQHVNNLTGLKGDMRARVSCEVGKFLNASSGDACTAAHLMKPVFAVDNQTVANNDGGGARPCVGMLVGFNNTLSTDDGLPMVWADATYAKLVQSSINPDRIDVKYATTGPLAANTYANGTNGLGATLTGNANGALAAIDGQTPALGDRVLVQFEATAANNGIYFVSQVGTSTTPYILTRDPQHATNADLPGSLAIVETGTFYAGQAFFFAQTPGMVVGTTAVTWTCVSGLQLTGKNAVRYATTAALAANTYANGNAGAGATLTANANGALAAQDGITPLAGDRVLVLFEAAGANNGIYVVTQVGTGALPYILTRAPDSNSAALLAGAEVLVEKGTNYGGMQFQLALQPSDITVGTTALNFSQLNSMAPAVVAFSATPTFTRAKSQQITLTANITGWTMPTGVADEEVVLIFVQDGTGSRTLAGTPANVRLAGGALTLSTGANKADIITFKWDASLGTPAWVEKSRSLNT